MRVKTSVTLPAELLVQIDQAHSNRSAFVEQASRAHLTRLKRMQRNERDAKIINANARRLNAEAKDVLGYQGIP